MPGVCWQDELGMCREGDATDSLCANALTYLRWLALLPGSNGSLLCNPLLGSSLEPEIGQVKCSDKKGPVPQSGVKIL